MVRFRFELAAPESDADLRFILAHSPMPGAISIAMLREPSFFAAAVVDGRFRQIVAARDCDANRLVGFGVRSIAERYVNGRPMAIGYLSNLRLLAEHRNRGLVARGYALFRKLHADGRTPLYLTTIAEDNEPALNLLTSGRAGLPAYHFAGRFHTFALPLHRRRRRSTIPGLTIRPAQAEDLGMLLEFLQRVGPSRQFFPCYQADDFFTREGAFRDLQPHDVLLAFRDGRLVGTLAGWDQHAFRQNVVAGYNGLLRWLRPAYNTWARLRGWPRLPRPGGAVRSLLAALPVIADDDPATFAALLQELLNKTSAGQHEYLLLGLHEADPLLPVARSLPAKCYTTRLHLVCWQDGEPLRATLDGRPPYLELGTL